MLFNSIPFIFYFLPVTFFGFFLLGRKSRQLAALWLSAASIFFYGWWNKDFVWLLLASVFFNYSAGYLISQKLHKPGGQGRVLLACAITADLLLLAYFKYAGFFSEVANSLFGRSSNIGHVILPLGISFFTFTQIAFLVDTYQHKAREYNFAHYLLFVTYFPHLIAGPILHHGQMMPQFRERKTYRISWENISAGVTIFVIGLAKKVLVADWLATIATPVFSAAQHGGKPMFLESWIGAVAYTLQLYFDFSGYSDMAIGLSLLFNIRLPLNFNSPYKSTSIIDFWRRWHMSLSIFLRDYLYIPLGGGRKGKVRRYANLLVTMLLGGLWHGAGLTFVFWGALHGVYLMINHGFRAARAKLNLQHVDFGWIGTLSAGGITFLSVVIAWVFFRADSFATAGIILHGMVGASGLRGVSGFMTVSGLSTRPTLVPIMLFLGACWLLPNTQQFMRKFHPAQQKIDQPDGWTASVAWQPAQWWTWCSVGILLAVCILTLSPARVSEFLYYQF